jgi:3-methyladenine DNA glycosylase AlkC
VKEENPSAFKHLISPQVVQDIGLSVKSVWPAFPMKQFETVSISLKNLELKPRVQAIRNQLRKYLPHSFPQALKILMKSLKKSSLSGFSLWPYTEFIQTYGLDYPEISLDALSIMTQKFTAEFAVRPFLVKDPARTYKKLLKWSEHSNFHIRRWTSEGTRPRLPWGMRLQEAIKDPTPGLKILEKLKYDDQLYVRKSVSNHLNDIAKDHPNLVVKTLKTWQTNCPLEHRNKIEWIQKQALRSLIKAGYKPALHQMGYGYTPQIRMGNLILNRKSFRINEVLTFQFKITSKNKKLQKIAVDYIIHHQKSKGKTSPKVFKLKVINLKPNETLHLIKNHSLKAVTTRKFYPGQHKIEIQINGKVYASATWNLNIP